MDTPANVIENKQTKTGATDFSEPGVDGTDAFESDMAGQFVAFNIDSESFAFPMKSVIEIIRVPDTVQVPLTPSSLLGLANLRGSVLPVLDLRRLLRLPEIEHTDATRVLVADCGKSVGLVVDRVERVLSVESENIESSEGVQTTVNADLLTGIIKNGNNGNRLTQLLDIKKAVHLEFETDHTMTAGSDELFADSHKRMTRGQPEESAEDDTAQLVNFVLDGQEYAFDIADVEEIVRVPDKINRVPCSDNHVLGIINLRNRLLPLVSLRRMFSLPEAPMEDHNRIVVVNLRENGGVQASVGIVVDQVREVLRVSSDVQDEMPSLLKRGEELAEVKGVCRLDDGKRLVSMLSTDRMFQRSDVQAALEAAKESEDRMASSGEGIQSDERTDDETQLVVFHLNDQEYSVMVEFVQEIIRVPEEMSRVPKTAEFIEGLVNLRGTVLPVLDMRVRFGLDRIDQNERQRILVLNLNGVRTGFIVDSLSEVLRVSRSVVETSPKLSEEQSRLMGQVAKFDGGKRMILILDAKELLDEHELDTIAKSSTGLSTEVDPIGATPSSVQQ